VGETVSRSGRRVGGDAETRTRRTDDDAEIRRSRVVGRRVDAVWIGQRRVVEGRARVESAVAIDEVRRRGGDAGGDAVVEIERVGDGRDGERE